MGVDSAMGDVHEFGGDRASVTARQQDLLRHCGCISANLPEVQRGRGILERAIHASTTCECRVTVMRIVRSNPNRALDDAAAIARRNRDFDSIALTGTECASRPPAKPDPSAGFGANA